MASLLWNISQSIRPTQISARFATYLIWSSTPKNIIFSWLCLKGHVQIYLCKFDPQNWVFKGQLFMIGEIVRLKKKSCGDIQKTVRQKQLWTGNFFLAPFDILEKTWPVPGGEENPNFLKQDQLTLEMVMQRTFRKNVFKTLNSTFYSFLQRIKTHIFGFSDLITER